MDIYFQNLLGFDVYMTVETADDGAITVRLYPNRQRLRRGFRLQQLLTNGETATVRDAVDGAKVSHDLTALTFRVRIEKRADPAGDQLFVYKLQNGHGHAS